MKSSAILTALFLFHTSLAFASNPLIIHEWGTLTCLEDEKGQVIPGINSDDEPVPSFVHTIADGLIVPPGIARSKAVRRLHPDVTMRLETPVLYVHAPPDFAGTLDVKVQFRGGWLTEFYPDATFDAPGLGTPGRITPDTIGTLHWTGLQIGGNATGPDTNEPVWLAPRQVDAAAIHTPSSESEKFLFYRGLGNELPILSIQRDPNTNVLRPFHFGQEKKITPPPPIWLADIRPDGSIAFQKVDPFHAIVPFQESGYSKLNLAVLRSSLESDLIDAGLYKDEAEALLNTWEVSYFKSPGLRAFFLCSPATVDDLLPLTITPAAEVTRVMIGRIELVTPAQRTAMARIAASPDSRDTSLPLYYGLGRFRDALLLDQQRRHPTPGLAQFISEQGIAFYKP